MNSLSIKIEEFAKLPHGNISVRIQNTTSEEIERVLDAIAKDADWPYKEAKTKNGSKIITYQTEWIGTTSLGYMGALSPRLSLMFKSLLSQIVEYVFIFNGDIVRLDIQSRYFATKNKLTYILYFLLYFLYVPAAFFDHQDKNRNNIQYILSALQMYFKDRIIILDKSQNEKWQESNRIPYWLKLF